MTTIIKPTVKTIGAQKLGYEDGQNVIRVDDRYYLIAQCDSGMLILFLLKDKMEWNRKTEPVKVSWSLLTTETIRDYFKDFKDFVVERVNANITFEILQ